MPPKYRVTTMVVSYIPSCFSTSSIGTPAVPLGSPSSLAFWISALLTIFYALLLLFALLCLLFISLMNAFAASSVGVRRMYEMKRDLLMTVSVSVSCLIKYCCSIRFTSTLYFNTRPDVDGNRQCVVEYF